MNLGVSHALVGDQVTMADSTSAGRVGLPWRRVEGGMQAEGTRVPMVARSMEERSWRATIWRIWMTSGGVERAVAARARKRVDLYIVGRVGWLD